jgi:hypothetical protein
MKKQVDVVMLPTEKASRILLSKRDGEICFSSVETKEDSTFKPQHLYFLSDDEIKEGDWVYHKLLKSVFKIDLREVDEDYIKEAKNIKKIIATTDESLRWNNDNDVQIIDNHHCKLPRPSNEFLKKFCELGSVDKVLVEYEKESYTDRFTTTENGIGNPETWGNRYNLKVAPDNTITIYPIE